VQFVQVCNVLQVSVVGRCVRTIHVCTVELAFQTTTTTATLHVNALMNIQVWWIFRYDEYSGVL